MLRITSPGLARDSLGKGFQCCNAYFTRTIGLIDSDRPARKA